MTRYVYLGTYTKSNSEASHRREGIYIFRMDTSRGTLNPASVAIDVYNPSFLDLHPSHLFLYSVNELEKGGASAFAVNQRTGALTFLNRQPTYGTAPCYLTLDPTGKWLLIANYGDGKLTVLPILKDGGLGPPTDLVQHYGKGVNKSRQETAHAHSVLFDPSGSFVLAADLGIDRIMVYRLDTQRGRLIPHDPPGASAKPGSGPRHMVFHPKGSFLYVANELDSTVSVYAWNSDKGVLYPIQILTTLPEYTSQSNFVADIHLTSSGKYLYVSNRGHDSLAGFFVNEKRGYLTPFGHYSTQGKWPRNFAIDLMGIFLLVANQNSNSVVTFRIKQETGQLISTGQITTIPSPVCVKMVDL